MQPLKLSYYVIFSDPVNKDRKRIIFSSRSGKGLIISDICYEFLNANLIEEIPEKIREKFIDAKLLVPADCDELSEVINENKDTIENVDGKHTLYEVIQPSAMCQLGCYYCGQTHTKANLTDELLNKIINRIKEKISKAQYKHLAIGWFGGEPLMALAQIRQFTKRIKTFCNEKRLKYSAKVVTNGLSLKRDIYLELVNELNVNKIEVTLDGARQYHDLHRYTKKGKGSFDLIFENLLSIVNREGYKQNISVRCNVDYKNIEGITPLIKLLAETGLHKKVAYFYTVGIYSWGGNEANKGSLSKEQFAKHDLEWMVEKYQNEYPSGSILPKRKKNVCMAVSNDSEMIDAYGNIFSCTEVSYSPVYQDKYLYNGNLSEPESITTDHPLAKWNDEVYEGKFQCQKCKILPVCGGTCPKSWHEKIPACPPMKFNLKERLSLSYILNHSTSETIKGDLETFLRNLKDKELKPV